MNKTRQVFEEWVIEQIPSITTDCLKKFNIEHGYDDSHINAIWVGFTAGAELSFLV